MTPKGNLSLSCHFIISFLLIYKREDIKINDEQTQKCVSV